MHKKWHINFESYFGALKIPQIGQQGRRNKTGKGAGWEYKQDLYRS